jgi:hypothetical protein
MGLRTRDSAGKDVPIGVLGVYFGPEPEMLYPKPEMKDMLRGAEKTAAHK